MTNEKSNNDIDWKSKLEELKSSEYTAFDKEAAWDKLHARLQPKRMNKKFAWYWLSAACLFFALFISIFLLNKPENVLVKNKVLQKEIDLQSSQHLPLITKDTSLVITSSLIENKTPVRSINKIEKVSKAIKHKMLPTEIVQNKKEESITREIKNTTTVMPVGTITSIVTNLPEKKKLKVIHINELGIPFSEPSVIARNSESHSFQLKLLKQEIYTGLSQPANSSRVKIFTTRNIPSN